MNPIKIAIVEDDDAYRNVLSRQLSQYSCFHIRYATHSSVEALPNIIRHDCDVAILDVVMPVKNGIQLTKELRVHGYKGKILALTAIENNSYFDELYSYGANRCILKNQLSQIGDTLLRLTMSRHKIVKEVDHLNDTEMKIIVEICNDHTNQQIGDKLNLSKRTVETYRQKIAEKLDIKNSTVSFIRYALQKGVYSFKE
jgi:DNA-binding NarL/FixJ family response regulator